MEWSWIQFDQKILARQKWSKMTIENTLITFLATILKTRHKTDSDTDCSFSLLPKPWLNKS